MTKAIPVRAHSRTLPDKHPPVFYQKCAELREEVQLRQAGITLDQLMEEALALLPAED